MNDSKTRRLPISLAAFDNLCQSGEMRSMHASIAELVSSENSTKIKEKMSKIYSVDENCIKTIKNALLFAPQVI